MPPRLPFPFWGMKRAARAWSNRPRRVRFDREKEHIESQAENDELRLRLNADRRRRFGPSGRALALLCECRDPGCHRTVLLTTEEYDRLRPEPVLHPSHERAAG
jgi:hypothetical protein